MREKLSSGAQRRNGLSRNSWGHFSCPCRGFEVQRRQSKHRNRVFSGGEVGSPPGSSSVPGNKKTPVPSMEKNLLHLAEITLYSLQWCIVLSSNYYLVTLIQLVDLESILCAC